DEVSSHGYAWGYIGSCIPFVVCLAIYVLAMFELVPLKEETAISIGFILTAIWWLVVSLPLYKSYRQKHYISEEEAKIEANLFTQVGHSIKEAAKDKRILLFLLAFFFYIDGVYTIIEEATAFGTSLNLDSIGLLSALLVTQVVAFPSALVVGKLAKKYSVEKMIVVCIIAYFCVGVYAIFLHSLTQFWILACCVGLFQGGIQALSRSYFTKIIPPEKSGELFGLYDVFGKGATFLGTFIVGAVTQATNNQNYGVAALTVFFIIGLVLFLLSLKQGKPKEADGSEEKADAAQATVSEGVAEASAEGSD
ncbi:MAG TPA: MFS transporter, partial [Clostridiales bacterium]|nr:MFS transporter [Clostridiales bacterium]